MTIDDEQRRRLEAKVFARPGDPVVRAELAAMLVGTHETEGNPPAPGLRAEAEAARKKARELIVGCLHLGLAGPALAAAEVLHRAFGRSEDAILLAEATVTRRDAGDLERARRLVEAVVENEPDALPARVRAAAFALGAGDAAAALRFVEPVAHETAETSALYVQTMLVMGRTATAIDEAKRALEAHPGSAELWEMLGAACLEERRPDVAIDAFSEVLRLAPERAQAHYNLALAFARAGSIPAALGVTDAGLEVRPSSVRLLELKAALQAALAPTGGTK